MSIEILDREMADSFLNLLVLTMGDSDETRHGGSNEGWRRIGEELVRSMEKTEQTHAAKIQSLEQRIRRLEMKRLEQDDALEVVKEERDGLEKEVC